MVDPSAYWKGLVEGTPADLDQVGHPDMGRKFNSCAYRLRLAALRRALNGSLNGKRFDSVFEAGFGVGYYMDFWRRSGARLVTGIELSETARNHVAALFPEYDLRAGDVADLARLSDWIHLRHQFDLVTALDLIYHLVDDDVAQRALSRLGDLVSPRGLLVFTEKNTGLDASYREGPLVTRRPLKWYMDSLGHCWTHVWTEPVFWCMDPPSRHVGSNASPAALAAWGAIRATLKYWPRNSAIQNCLGGVIGTFGATLDHIVSQRATRVSNLTIYVVQKN